MQLSRQADLYYFCSLNKYTRFYKWLHKFPAQRALVIRSWKQFPHLYRPTTEYIRWTVKKPHVVTSPSIPLTVGLCEVNLFFFIKSSNEIRTKFRRTCEEKIKKSIVIESEFLRTCQRCKTERNVSISRDTICGASVLFSPLLRSSAICIFTFVVHRDKTRESAKYSVVYAEHILLNFCNLTFHVLAAIPSDCAVLGVSWWWQRTNFCLKETFKFYFIKKNHFFYKYSAPRNKCNTTILIFSENEKFKGINFYIFTHKCFLLNYDENIKIN